jgi:hypothetical protein
VASDFSEPRREHLLIASRIVTHLLRIRSAMRRVQAVMNASTRSEICLGMIARKRRNGAGPENEWSNESLDEEEDNASIAGDGTACI